MLGSMRRLLVIAAVFSLGTWSLGADEFWQQLTPAERAAAGLDQLTPEQRALLDQLAARFARTGINQAVKTAKEVVRTEAARAEQEKKKASIGLAPREEDETEVLRTHIVGDFHGWEGNTLFHLENNQVWQQTTTEIRYFPKLVDMEVEIRPSRFGGWKMTLLKEGLWVRVKRIR